ncbi:hypothetical protein [Streptomyces rubiginosohelvolus]|uniref:hypothetical protein n=1 Tax=Streptomyces rubiginosohelvolus TaxID=67362 RepID=UPI0035DCBC2F
MRTTRTLDRQPILVPAALAVPVPVLAGGLLSGPQHLDHSGIAHGALQGEEPLRRAAGPGRYSAGRAP